MELATAKCGKGHRHRVWLSGRDVYVEVSGCRRRAGYANGALHAMQVALSFLAVTCG
jgi:hypothetical protein